MQLDVDRLELRSAGCTDRRARRRGRPRCGRPARSRCARLFALEDSSPSESIVRPCPRCCTGAGRARAHRPLPTADGAGRFRHPRRAAYITLELLWISRHILTWVFIALFLTLALNPGGRPARASSRAPRGGNRHRLRHGPDRRRADRLALRPDPGRPGEQLRAQGAGLPRRPHQGPGPAGLPAGEVPPRRQGAESACDEGGASKLFGLSGTALAVAKGVVNAVLATVTIIFMTFFMLLEGRNWVERFFSLLKPESRPRWQSGRARHLPDGRRLRHRQPR